MQLIQYEGRTVAVIAPEDLEQLERENAKLRESLVRSMSLNDSTTLEGDEARQRAAQLLSDLSIPSTPAEAETIRADIDAQHREDVAAHENERMHGLSAEEISIREHRRQIGDPRL